MRRSEELPIRTNGGVFGRPLMDTDTPPGTVIGKKIGIRGSIEGDEDLRVEGHVEGTIRLSETLRIELGGEVDAEVQVKSAVVLGVMRGDIQATELVRITATGKMEGDILAPRVVMEDGAVFRGRIDMNRAEEAAHPLEEEPDIPMRLVSGE